MSFKLYRGRAAAASAARADIDARIEPRARALTRSETSVGPRKEGT